jgi:hypothetical protein
MLFCQILAGPVIPPKPQATRGIDLDAQGVINGQPTYEHDLMNSYKDDEKPWKKPGLIDVSYNLKIFVFFRSGYK